MSLKPHSLPEDRVVVFLDLLGFRDTVDRIFSTGDGDAFARLLEILHGTSQKEEQRSRRKELDVLGKSRAWPRSRLSHMPEVVISAFSDSVVLSAEAAGRGPPWALLLAGFTMLQLIEEGISSRGAAAIGPMYHARGVFVGPAFIEAYKLEGEAENPRLVLSPELARQVRGLREYQTLAPLRSSEGGLEHLDLFQLVDGEEERVVARFASIRRGLERLISEAESQPDPNLREKCRKRQLWLAREFDRVVEDRPIPGIQPITSMR